MNCKQVRIWRDAVVILHLPGETEENQWFVKLVWTIFRNPEDRVRPASCLPRRGCCRKCLH